MLSEHFSESEFACHHCGEVKANPRLIELLEELRYNTGGLPLEINSGYRCPYWNEHEGGASNSQHLYGNAADVACPSHLTMGQFKWYCEQLPFDAIGYYYRGEHEGWIHVDVRYGGTTGEEKIYWEN